MIKETNKYDLLLDNLRNNNDIFMSISFNEIVENVLEKMDIDKLDSILKEYTLEQLSILMDEELKDGVYNFIGAYLANLI